MVSTQRPLHISAALAQPPHMPSRHPWAAAQTVPQAPQLAGSLLVSTHWLAHRMVLPWQETTQTPASHDWPAAQRLSQAPQLAKLRWVFVHRPPHRV